MPNLPAAEQSLAVRYDNYARFRFRGDPRLAAQYIPKARAIHGELRNQLALGGIDQGTRFRILPNGVVVRCLWDGALDIIEIDVTPLAVQNEKIDWRPKFLFYEKELYGGTYRLGYWYGEDGIRLPREVPYIIGEPEVWPGFYNTIPPQFNSITEASYAQKDLEHKVLLGKNPKYGNQRFFRESSSHPYVYSWWGSPFGDLPHLVLKNFSHLLRANHLYAPVYLIQESVYCYLTEEYAVTWLPPLSVYRNDKVLCTVPGAAGLSLIAGVGLGHNNDVLILVASEYTITFYYWRASLVEPQSGKFIMTSNEIASHPWRFNDAGTKAAGIMMLPGDDEKDTLHVVEIDIHYNSNTQSYTATESRRTPYTGFYKTVLEAHNVYEVSTGSTSGYPIDRGEWQAGTYGKTVDIQDSTKTTTWDREWPAGVRWDGSRLVVATLHHIDTQVDRYYHADNIHNHYETWYHIPEFSPNFQNFNETRNSGLSITDIIKTRTRTITTELKWDGKAGQDGDKENLMLEHIVQTYRYRLDNEDSSMIEQKYDSFTPTWCPPGPPEDAGDPLSADWVRTTTNQNGFVLVADDLASTTGFDVQLLSVNLKDRTAFYVKTNYNVTEERAFDKNVVQSGKSIQTVTYYQCTPYATVNISSQCDADASYVETDIKNDYSSAAFTVTVPSSNAITIGDSVGLKSSSVPGPYNRSNSSHTHDQDDDGPSADCGNDSANYIKHAIVSGATPSFSAPYWSTGVGPVIGKTYQTVDYSHTDIVTIYLLNDLSNGLCNRHFRGASSFASDASLKMNGSDIESQLNKSTEINNWIYACNAAGFFVDPTYTFTPTELLDAGGLLTKRFGCVLDNLEHEFSISEPTAYPIGWSIKPIRTEE